MKLLKILIIVAAGTGVFFLWRTNKAPLHLATHHHLPYSNPLAVTGLFPDLDTWRGCVASWYPMWGNYGERFPALFFSGDKRRVKEHAEGCAYNYAPLGAWLIVHCPQTGRTIKARVVDRIGEKEYYDRIDLNAWLFEALGLSLQKGLGWVYVIHTRDNRCN